MRRGGQVRVHAGRQGDACHPWQPLIDSYWCGQAGKTGSQGMEGTAGAAQQSRALPACRGRAGGGAGVGHSTGAAAGAGRGAATARGQKAAPLHGQQLAVLRHCSARCQHIRNSLVVHNTSQQSFSTHTHTHTLTHLLQSPLHTCLIRGWPVPTAEAAAPPLLPRGVCCR